MMLLTRRAMGASTLAILAGCATGAQEATETAPARPAPAIGSFGVDLAARDLTVKPGDDFAHYAQGAWMANTEIPGDRTRWGTFDILREKADRDARTIIEEVALAGGAPGTNQQKIADFYNSFLNQEAINAAGVAPLQAELDQIAALRTHEQAIRLISTPGIAVNSPIAVFVGLDERNPDRYICNKIGRAHV